MPATAPDAPESKEPGGPPFARSADQEYFRAVERAFVALRGTPFQMSPDDFAVAREWRAEGVSVELVAEVLAEVIERRRERNEEIPLRLAYYRRAVAAKFKERRRLQAPGDALDTPGLDLPRRLDALARAVGDALLVAEVAGALEAVEVEKRLRALAEATDLSVDQVEDELVALDREILDTARDALDPEARHDLAARLESASQTLADRLPGGVSATARQRLADELTRRRIGLPVLSVFAPEAAAGEEAAHEVRDEVDSP